MAGLADGRNERRRAVTFASDTKTRSAAVAVPGGHAPDETAADTSLFATIGLSGILRPAEGAAKAAAHRPRATMRAFCWLVVGLQTAQAVRLSRSWDRGPRLVYEAINVTVGLLCMYKGLVLVSRADGVREVLRVARFGFTRCNRRNPHELRRCGATLYAWFRAFVVLTVCAVGLWSSAEWLDAPAARSASARVPWAAWATSQTISFAGFAYSNFMFDLCVATACFALDVQFRMVSESCATVGHRTPPAAAFSSTEDNCKNSDNTRLEDYYDELIYHIHDMQKLTKKLDDFYAIVRPVTIVQVIISCLSLTTYSFFTLQMCLMGWSDAPTSVLRFFSGFLAVAFQLFTYCYAFNLVDTARSTLNFGLYSSNWTEMNLKFQKTMLLAMKINSAHKQDMKITPKLKVDLELFGKTIGLSYRIVSVLVNK